MINQKKGSRPLNCPVYRFFTVTNIMAQALKITFVDGDMTISDDEDLIYYAQSAKETKDRVVRANYENCLTSQIKAAYEMSAKSWEVIQYQPVVERVRQPSLLKRLVFGV